MAQVSLETKCVVLNKNKSQNKDKIHFLGVDFHVKDWTFEEDSSNFLAWIHTSIEFKPNFISKCLPHSYVNVMIWQLQ